MLFDLDFVITSWVVEWVKVCLLQKLVLRITKGNGHPDTSYLRLTILNVETNYGTIFDNVLRKVFRSYLHIIIQNFCTRGFHPMHFQFLQLQEMHNRVLSKHMAANVWTNLSWCVIVYVMAWYRPSTSYYRHAYSPILFFNRIVHSAVLLDDSAVTAYLISKIKFRKKKSSTVT